MNAIYLQPFTSYDDELIPPPFTYEPTLGYINPDNDVVISMRDGIVISRYGDDAWDLSPYCSSTAQRSILFNTIISDTLKKEAKRLTYIVMTHSTGKSNVLPSGNTIGLKYDSVIRPLAEYIQHLAIEHHKKNFNYILSNPKRLRHFIMSYTQGALHTSVKIKSVLTLLNQLSKERSGFDYIYNKYNNKILDILETKYKETLSQTILIPASIYSAAAKGRWTHIDAIEPYVKNLAGFIADYSDCKGFGAADTSNLSNQERQGFVQWNKAVDKYNLQPLFEKYSIEGLKTLPSFITMIQGTCRHLIHQYTGMRNNECISLSRNCWKKKNSEMPSRILGIEQKIHGVPIRQVWITHDAIERVIELLKVIGEPMAKRANHDLVNPPLMIKTSKLKREIGSNHYNALLVGKKIKELPLDKQDLTLTKEHIKEMSLVDDRDWSEHKWIKEGAVWHFTTHQYRRALAVYALGSGLVSLHAIKEQFGHLISTMTAFYGNGHKRARKLDGFTEEQDHIARYMIKIKKDMMFYSYRHNVLLSKTPLWGANGIHFGKHIIARTPEEREVVMRNSKKLKKEFKKSGKYYEDTAVGGCTKALCEKRLLPDFFLFINCKGCEHSIHKLEKLERLTEKSRVVAMKWAKVYPDGIDHRTTVKLYEELNHFTDILKKKEEKLKS